MLLRKQTTKKCRWETRVSFQPTSQQEEAGLVVWWNYLNYSTIAICMSLDGRLVRFQPAEGEAVSRQTERSDSDVHLYVECGSSYRFGFGESTDDVRWLGQVSNEVMTRQPAAGMAFTGMMIGVYATSRYERSLNPADFHYLECKAVAE